MNNLVDLFSPLFLSLLQDLAYKKYRYNLLSLKDKVPWPCTMYIYIFVGNEHFSGSIFTPVSLSLETLPTIQEIYLYASSVSQSQSSKYNVLSSFTLSPWLWMRHRNSGKDHDYEY